VRTKYSKWKLCEGTGTDSRDLWVSKMGEESEEKKRGKKMGEESDMRLK
jgi:hypothetical protein